MKRAASTGMTSELTDPAGVPLRAPDEGKPLSLAEQALVRALVSAIVKELRETAEPIRVPAA